MAPNRQIRTILLFADGSEGAIRAAELAVHLAQVHDADLVAVAVVDTETLSMLLRQHILIDEERAEFDAELEASAERQLNLVANQARRQAVPAETALLRGNTHSAILAEARRRNADLIVLSGFTSTMTRRDLLAKQKQYIVDEAPCPVVLVK